MALKNTNKDGILTIYLKGNVDSNNSETIEKEINEIEKSTVFKQLVLDAAALDYISSAGLRVVLRQKKQTNDFRVINVSSDIYEIFEMTGFTEMMRVEKAYRVMNLTGCEVIGEGSNGIVYRYDRDTVVKVYKNPDSLPDIQKEKQLARRALIMGLNTAISYDVVKVNDKYASVFELVNSDTMTKLINTYPDNFEEYVGVYANLLKEIHQLDATDEELPSQKAIALDWVTYLKGHISDEEYEKLYTLVNNVPEKRKVIHGDYHIQNLYYHNKETTLIDMDTLAYGNPVFEFGPIFLAYVGFGEVDPKVVEDFLGVDYSTCQRIWKRTLEIYFETEDEARIKEIEDKAKVVGYTRLLRRTIKRIGYDDPFGAKQIAYCKEQLSDLLSRIDSIEL